MKQFILIFILIVSSAGLAISGPELTIENDIYEFGHLPQHSTVFHYFWFKSTGDETLVINEIKTGCVCALMPLEKNEIAPGDSMKVGISWDIKNSISTSGRYPYIFTNAKEDAYRVQLLATVMKSMDSLFPLSASPYILELPVFKGKSTDELEFELINIHEEDIEIVIVSHDLEECEIDIPLKIPAKSSVKGKIKVKAEYLDKEFKNSITILVAGFANKRITIPIRRKIY